MTSPEFAPALPSTNNSNSLAVAALVLGCVSLVLPLVGPIAIVLGIIALVKRQSKGMAIAGIVIPILVLTIFSFVAVSAFNKYIRRSKAIEATLILKKLGTQVLALDPDQLAKLPDSDWTPGGKACGQPNDRFAPDPSAFQAAPWSTLSFSIDDPHYYQYRLRHDGDAIVVEARGDLDCDGTYSLFRRTVRADGSSDARVTSENELE